MSEKSHVGMGFALCPVCGRKHDETVLIDKRMRNTLERENFTGWLLCAEDEKKFDEGYTALVVVTNTTQPTLETAIRTGELIHVRNEAWPKLFNTPLPPKRLAFIDVETAEAIKQMAQES